MHEREDDDGTRTQRGGRGGRKMRREEHEEQGANQGSKLLQSFNSNQTRSSCTARNNNWTHAPASRGGARNSQSSISTKSSSGNSSSIFKLSLTVLQMGAPFELKLVLMTH